MRTQKKLYGWQAVCMFFVFNMSLGAQLPRNVQTMVEQAVKETNNCVFRINEAHAYALGAVNKAIEAHQIALDQQVVVGKNNEDIKAIQSEITSLRAAVPTIQREIAALTEQQKNELMQLAESLKERALKVETIEAGVARARIEAEIASKAKYGIYEKEAKILGQAHVEGELQKERERWKNLSDSTVVSVYGLAITVVAFALYSIKYGLPIILNRYTQPQIISETSLGNSNLGRRLKVEDLVFVPDLQQQLGDLVARVQHAKKYSEPYPNILFYGPSGTGKTAFAKALAYASGLDYALTSGSEFAKIVDQPRVHDELRNLFSWAKKSSKGVIIFIDEAESLFASRRFSSTTRHLQDLIHTFLSLVAEQSQKKIMFIFATNNPHKLDDALLNRVGVSIEFILPGAAEREKILLSYVTREANANKNELVGLHPDFRRLLPTYAESLDGFSPRALKFIAQEMVVKARISESMDITSALAQRVIDTAKNGQQQLIEWRKNHA